jgi:hypothetical protein
MRRFRVVPHGREGKEDAINAPLAENDLAFLGRTFTCTSPRLILIAKNSPAN